MSEGVNRLFQQILEWYENKKGPLPIKPQLRIFPDLKSFLDFVKPTPGHEEAVCITQHDGVKGEVIIAVNASRFIGHPRFSNAWVLLHELEHARENTADGVITVELIESLERHRQREVRLSITAFELAQEFTGFRMPKIVEDYVKRRFQTEL